MSETENNVLQLPIDVQMTAMMREAERGVSLQGGGGGDTFDPMEARVTALETDMRSIREMLIRIESKLDTKASSTELAELKGKLDAKASTADMGSVLGKIEGRPTTLQVLSMIVLLGGIMAGSQIIKTIYDLWHSPSQIQTTR